MENSVSSQLPSGGLPFLREWAAEEDLTKSRRRGVIYARYSTDIQDTSESIEVQIAECRKYALANDILLCRKPFVDRAETGTSTENRKSYQELLTLARGSERDFDLILTFHTSRWGRGVESEIDEYGLEKCGVKIIAVSQPFTADDGVESVFMKGVLRKIDAYYSMQASKYTHAYQASNAEHGFKNGGAPPDGYSIEHVPTGKRDKRGLEKMKARLILDKKPGKFDVIDQPRFKLIEFAFTHARDGRGIRWLGKEIHRQGWRSRYRPEPISPATIRTWLINAAYTGYMVWNRVKFLRRNGKRTYVPNPVSKWVCSSEPSHPAIISKETYETVASKFLRRPSHHGPTPGAGRAFDAFSADNRGRYLLSGLLQCRSCGSNYVAAKNIHRKKRTQVYYVCNTKWRRGRDACAGPNVNLAVAEGATLDKLFNTVLTEGEVKRFIDAFNLFVNEQAERSQPNLTKIDRECERIRLEMDRIKQAILSGADPRSFAPELNERQALLDRLEGDRRTVSSTTSRDQITYDPKRFEAWVLMLKRNFLSAEFETRRELVRKFVYRIEVRQDRTAELTWNPEAVLRLADGPRVPSTALMVMKTSCGGMKQTGRHYPRPKVLLKFEIKGKSRWPFGYEILRELAGGLTPTT
jgi:site-specific DNA recombinase